MDSKVKIYRNLRFWKITTNVGIVLAVIGLICSQFFYKHFESTGRKFILLLEIFGVTLFLISQLVIFLSTTKKHEKR